MEWEMLKIEEEDNRIRDDEQRRREIERQYAAGIAPRPVATPKASASAASAASAATSARGGGAKNPANDVNAPWWFRLAPILMGRRQLKANKKACVCCCLL
jgi:hypothetical protein